MRTIEQAIRHALQKIDTANPTLRNKLYQMAWQTHEKMLGDLADLPEDEKQQRRITLKNIIQAIEAEFQISAQPAMEATKGRAPPAATMATTPTSPALSTSSMSVADSSAHPIMADSSLIAPTRHQNTQQTTIRKKPSSLRGNGFLLVLVAVLLFVAWFFYNSLINTNPPASPNTPSPSVTELIEQDGFENLATMPPRQETPSPPAREWIRLFDPANIEAIRTRGAAHVQLHENEGVPFIRLTTRGEEDAIILELASGFMMQAQGKAAIFNLISRSATGQLAQLSVACDFGAIASCGRWRFELPPMREDLLFGVDIIGDDIEIIQADSVLTLTISLRGDANDDEHKVDIFALEASFDD